MDGLFLLYALTFVPIAPGPHQAAYETGRKAFLMQSGAQAEWDVLNAALRRLAPKPARYAGAAYTLVHKKELRFKSSRFGTWLIKKDAVQFSITIPFSL